MRMKTAARTEWTKNHANLELRRRAPQQRKRKPKQTARARARNQERPERTRQGYRRRRDSARSGLAPKWGVRSLVLTNLASYRTTN